MPVYYIKDRANGIDPKWGDPKLWQSLHKQDLKEQRNWLNNEHPSKEGLLKRFVIGEMK